MARKDDDDTYWIVLSCFWFEMEPFVKFFLLLLIWKRYLETSGEHVGDDIEQEIGVCSKNLSVVVPETYTEHSMSLESYRDCSYSYYSCPTKYRTVPKTLTKLRDIIKIFSVKHCCNGYEETASSPIICEPICNPPCVNGTCTSPGKCSCTDGHEESNKPNICKPVCDPPCVNATCIDVNTCQCNSGYIFSTANECSPSCNNSCLNGNCIAPNTCECFHNYVATNNSNICEPVCSLECINGKCTTPGYCDCDKGYVESVYWNICVPFCSEACVNSECSHPEICTCYDGFEEINGTCSPICSEDCDNGVCMAPETCICNRGYTRASNYCEPVCYNGCLNGNCTGPEICSCNEGYELQYEKCEPICNETCLNGYCTGPNECICNEDTIKVNQYECIEICKETTDTECMMKSEILTLSNNKIFNIGVSCELFRHKNKIMNSQEYLVSLDCYSYQNLNGLYFTCFFNQSLSNDTMLPYTYNTTEDVKNKDIHFQFFYSKTIALEHKGTCQIHLSTDTNSIKYDGYSTTLKFYVVAVEAPHSSVSLIVGLSITTVCVIIVIVGAIVYRKIRRGFKASYRTYESDRPLSKVDNEIADSTVLYDRDNSREPILDNF